MAKKDGFKEGHEEHMGGKHSGAKRSGFGKKEKGFGAKVGKNMGKPTNLEGPHK
jgi:hypothetical protein